MWPPVCRSTSFVDRCQRRNEISSSLPVSYLTRHVSECRLAGEIIPRLISTINSLVGSPLSYWQSNNTLADMETTRAFCFWVCFLFFPPKWSFKVEGQQQVALLGYYLLGKGKIISMLFLLLTRGAAMACGCDVTTALKRPSLGPIGILRRVHQWKFRDSANIPCRLICCDDFICFY